MERDHKKLSNDRPGGLLGPLELVSVVGQHVTTHPLPPNGSVTIGRGDENHVRINHPSISRRHAVLHLGPPLSIEDLGTTNGTYVHSFVPPAPSEGTYEDLPLVQRKIAIEVGDALNFGRAVAVIRRAPAATEGVSHPASCKAVLRDGRMRALHDDARLAARGTISVLVLGETGVGKDVMARAIHDESSRASRPFRAINCGAFAESLLETELFGHERGAFTGALHARAGLFESADGGTVFLDEVGELSSSMQVKLLRLLDEKEVLRVGANTPRRVDVRFISATNRDLEAEVGRGAFRRDLYFRLNGLSLSIPPLRERTADIGPLAHHFAARYSEQLGRSEAPAISAEAMVLLERHSWPGNVRELRNVFERACVLLSGPVIEPVHLPEGVRASGAPRIEEEVAGSPMTRRSPGVASSASPPHGTYGGAAKGASSHRIDETDGGFDAAEDSGPVIDDSHRIKLSPDDERRHIIAALEQCGGNQTQAAARLGISRRTLVVRIEAYGLPRPRKKEL